MRFHTRFHWGILIQHDPTVTREQCHAKGGLVTVVNSKRLTVDLWRFSHPKKNLWCSVIFCGFRHLSLKPIHLLWYHDIMIRTFRKTVVRMFQGNLWQKWPAKRWFRWRAPTGEVSRKDRLEVGQGCLMSISAPCFLCTSTFFRDSRFFLVWIPVLVVYWCLLFTFIPMFSNVDQMDYWCFNLHLIQYPQFWHLAAVRLIRPWQSKGGIWVKDWAPTPEIFKKTILRMIMIIIIISTHLQKLVLGMVSLAVGNDHIWWKVGLCVCWFLSELQYNLGNAISQ